MARKVFYSFHYDADAARAALVRNIGAIEGNSPASDNDWESIKRGGDPAIRNWINNQLFGKSCAVVLIGTNTAGRRWIDYEIEQAWRENKGLFGIYIHNLSSFGKQSIKGANPFAGFTIDNKPMSSIVNAYDPPYWASTDVYNYIANNIAAWIDTAIATRARYA